MAAKNEKAIERRKIDGKGKEIAEAILAPPVVGSDAIVAHMDLDVDPEPMICERGYWYHGCLSPAREGRFGPSRFMYDATWGVEGDKRGSGCAFWIPSQTALMKNVLAWPAHRRVTMQCLGQVDLGNGQAYTRWQVWTHPDNGQAVVSVDTAQADLPF